MKPWESPYVTFGDNPIAFMDPSGLSQTNPNTNPNVTPPTDAGQEMDYEGSHFSSTLNNSGNFEWTYGCATAVIEANSIATARTGMEYVENENSTVGGHQVSVGSIGNWGITARYTDNGTLVDYYAGLIGEDGNGHPKLLMGADGLHELALHSGEWEHKVWAAEKYYLPGMRNQGLFGDPYETAFVLWKQQVSNPFNWLVAGEAFVLSLPKPSPVLNLVEAEVTAAKGGFKVEGQLAEIFGNKKLFLNWLKGNYSLSRVGNPLNAFEAQQIISNAKNLGLPIESNLKGLQGLEVTGQWGGVPHFKVGNVHIPIEKGLNGVLKF